LKSNRDKHYRRSIRLKGYDYAQCGAYFVTICAQNRKCLFGDIQRNEWSLNDAGKMLYRIWNNVPNTCPGFVIDKFVVMPNHVHGIISTVGAPLVGALPEKDRAGTHGNRAGTRPAPTTLGDVVGIFKSISTHQYAMNVHANKWPPFPGKLWQRNYYEHIRNENELNHIWKYIINNPLQWDNDENNPANYGLVDS
jgi:putative transposase